MTYQYGMVMRQSRTLRLPLVMLLARQHENDTWDGLLLTDWPGTGKAGKVIRLLPRWWIEA